jgi:hypothetical protein
MATGERGRDALGYERDALSHFQWWRLFSAHLVHLNWRHALLNCAGLVVLWALFAREFSAAMPMAVDRVAGRAVHRSGSVVSIPGRGLVSGRLGRAAWRLGRWCVRRLAAW